MSGDSNDSAVALAVGVIVALGDTVSGSEVATAVAEAGAGGVIVKSLFEEVLAGDDWGLESSTSYHPEAFEYLNAELQMQYGPGEYCDLISQAKKAVSIPVIGSINCVSAKWWPEFAKKIEAAGADGLELNVFKIPVDTEQDSLSIEKLYYEVIESVKSVVSIPVAMKIGSNFTSLPHLITQLTKRGLDGIVLFNRFTEPDIDIHSLKLKTTFSFSSREDIHPVLRWVALLYDRVSCDLSATTGIHTSEGIIKLLLAGASSVQLASALYRNGMNKIEELLSEIKIWMEQYQLNSVADFKGKVHFAPDFNAEMYLRAQFMEKIRGVE